jgi:hypothetical protein
MKEMNVEFYNFVRLLVHIINRNKNENRNQS